MPVPCPPAASLVVSSDTRVLHERHKPPKTRPGCDSDVTRTDRRPRRRFAVRTKRRPCLPSRFGNEPRIRLICVTRTRLGRDVNVTWARPRCTRPLGASASPPREESRGPPEDAPFARIKRNILILLLIISNNGQSPRTRFESGFAPRYRTREERLSESPIRVAYPSRLSQPPFEIAYPSPISGSHIRVAYPSRLSLSPIRVALRCRLSVFLIRVAFFSRLSESQIRVAYSSLISESPGSHMHPTASCARVTALSYPSRATLSASRDRRPWPTCPSRGLRAARPCPSRYG